MTDRFAGPSYTRARTTGRRIGTLYWNGDEGDVKVSAYFDGLAGLTQAYAIRDAIGVLEREYNDAMDRMRADLAPKATSISSAA